ncbi:MAG TPA: CBS domain-containing protein [Nitrososphaeraceae archaeon]|nr:CBS domain-containing protein [Nitrososphaeraceae archaeon]
MTKRIIVLRGQSKLYGEILELATEPINKQKILKELSLSHQQLRRYTAELVDKGLLHYYEENGNFIRTERGNLYLSKLSSSNNKSDNAMLLLSSYDISREIISLESDNTLLDARNFIIRYNISRVVVLDNNKKLAGIITEKDISKFLYSTFTDKRLSEISIKDIMTKKLLTADMNSSINDSIKIMIDNNISSVIVTDNENNPKGIITKTDLVEYCAYHLKNKFITKDSMSKKVHTVFPDENIHMIILLMNTFKISRIIVIEHDKPIGIVTYRNLLPLANFFVEKTKNSKGAQTINNQRFIPSGLNSILISQDIMTSTLLTVSENTDLSDAAKIMIRNRISGLPVVNNKGLLTGILTKTDIVKTLYKEFVDINKK